MQGVWFIVVYMIITNIMGFAIMGVDKRKARNGEDRISEKTLWFWAVIGGGTGSFLGMKHFRHKTKHGAFKWGLPILMILQIGLLIKIFIQW
jgi:uncharacterized membrane protein YsdA (DUF1294 family)